MAGPKSYFTPGRGYLNETNDHSFFIPGWGYVNEQQFFSASLALTQPAASAAITQREKFIVSLTAAQQAATTGITAAEKFFEALVLTAPANNATLNGVAASPSHPGSVTIADAAQGGLLVLGNQATSNAAAADAALYDVQITESI